ncbi:MAG TPA: hypothetical protein VI489_03390, partial [Candidatus Brocadiaceae bacterium]
MIQEAKSKFEDNNHVIPEALFTNLLALLTSSIGMSEKSKPTTAEAGVPVLAFSPATTLNPEQETKVPLTKNIFDIQNKKGTETQSASSGLAAAETCATRSCTEKINYLYAIEDTTMSSPPEIDQFSTQKDRDEILLPLDYGNKSKTQPALPVRHLLGGDVGDLETPDANPLAHQLHTVKGEIIITEPHPFSNGPFPLKARLLTGSFAFSAEAGLVTGSAFTGVRNAKPLKAELLEIDLLNTLQNENNKDTQSSSPPVSGNLQFALPENKDTASPVRGSMLYNIIPANPDNLVTLEASNGTSEGNNKLSMLNRLQQEIHNTEPKTAVKDVINQFVDATNDMVEVTNVITNEAKDKTKPPQTIIAPPNMNNIKPPDTPLSTQTVFRDEIASALPRNDNTMESNDPAYGEANPQQQVAGQNPSSLSIDSKINTNTQTAEQTQPAFRPTNGGQVSVGYLETPNTKSLTYQAATRVEYKSMSELSTPEITLEEITYPRTVNPMPQEGLVSVLEKPVRQQSTSYTNTNPLSAPDGIPVLAEPNVILLARQDTALKTPAWEQALITKRGIIVEPQPLSNFANIQENQPLTNSEKTSYTSNAFLVFGEGSQTSMLKKAELLEIDLSNTIQEVNNLTLERVSRSPERSEGKGKDAQPLPSPFVPNEQKPNLVFALPEDKDTSSEANNKLSMLNRLQQEIHNTEPKIAVKNIISQYVIADNDTVEVTDVVTNEAKNKTQSPQTIIAPLNTNNIKPLDTAPPTQTVDKQTIVHQDTTIEHTVAKEHTKNTQTEKTDIQLNVNKSNTESNNPAYGDDNPRRHVAGQNLLTLPMDYKISTNTQTAGQTGTKPEIVQNETSNLPS